MSTHLLLPRKLPRHTRSGPGVLSSRRTAAGLALWLAFAGWNAALAEVRLPSLFTDHLVLQRDKPIAVWGWADADETVVVEFRRQSVKVQPTAGGLWRAQLKAEKAGGPDRLVVRGKNQIQLQDVLVGEVWVCSGQSNMEWPLRASFEPQADIATATNSHLRLFTVPKKRAEQPLVDVAAKWEECRPTTVPGFSAVAFYFGRSLQAALGVPVGLIHTSWGGSPAEVWMSDVTLRTNPEYRQEILDTYPAVRSNYEKALAEWEKAKAEAASKGEKFERGAPWPPWCPSELYNGMIAPLIPYSLRGAIWYQGESNAGRAEQYRRLFPDMIRNWRRDWGQGEFPFLAVQLAPWDFNRKRPLEQITAAPGESSWAELREAQMVATQVLPNVGVVVITDVGDKDDIHPTKKRPVGERLALAARVIAHSEKTPGLSPVYRSSAFGAGQAVLTFDRVGSGLEARGGALTGFAIAGPDRKWVWAEAQVTGPNTVTVRNPTVTEPIAVRYGWADYPVVNLFSRDGLPVSPFRTDAFPLTTTKKGTP